MGSRRAMVVDDDRDIRELVAEFLAQSGYAVTVARSGLHAFELLARTPPPELLVVDLMMPELSGQELLVRVREFPRFAQMPILAMSAVTRVPPRGEPFDGFLPKPFDMPTLSAAIEKAFVARLAALG